MININDINKQKALSNAEKQAFEKKMQQDDLSYLASVAFEQFAVNQVDIDGLHLLIDKKSKPSFNQFNTVFISVLCGLLIGVSVFFVIFQKNKTHPSVYQSFQEEVFNEHKLNKVVNAEDTLFPLISNDVKPNEIEHFTINESAVNIEKTEEAPETLPTKKGSLDAIETEDNQELILQFIPNAPVVFINNMKVTNYRLYYFKRNEGINLAINTGVSAQYENSSNIERTILSKNSTYFAHKIIQRAMRLFNSKDYTSCIEELNLLYDYNKDDANAQFYLGLCYYQLGKHALAQSFFNKNLDNAINIFHQESEFYEALCLLKTNQLELGKIQLHRIVDNKGFYGDRAKEVLEKQ
jgi:tetratricopeptide (TPR) repeat protein